MRKSVTLVLLALAAHAPAKEQKIACPEELEAAAVRITEPPKGWSGLVPARFRLQAAGITLGPLEQHAAQLGETEKLGAKRFKVSYPFMKDSSEEKWLTCRYGVNEGLVLGRRLPDDTRTCEMLYTPDGHGLFDIDITCK